jgi:hypothetical protein
VEGFVNNTIWLLRRKRLIGSRCTAAPSNLDGTLSDCFPSRNVRFRAQLYDVDDHPLVFAQCVTHNRLVHAALIGIQLVNFPDDGFHADTIPDFEPSGNRKPTIPGNPTRLGACSQWLADRSVPASADLVPIPATLRIIGRGEVQPAFVIGSGRLYAQTNSSAKTTLDGYSRPEY